MTLKEILINTLVDSMSLEDLQQYVANDMADFLYNCSESEVIKNEFLIKIEHTLEEQFYNKFVKQINLQPLNCNPSEYSIIMSREKGLNIDVTRGQYMMLYNIMCEHNQMVNPQANPDFDLQTFDNLFQAITMAKETYL